MAGRKGGGKPGLSQPARIGQVPPNGLAGAGVNQAQQIARAMATWPRLAEAAALPSAVPKVAPLLTRSDDKGARLVLALESAGRRLILKQDEPAAAGDNTNFTRSLAAQDYARLRLAGNTQGLRVPKVLAFLPEQGIALMERLDGEPAAHLLEKAESRNDRREVLAACGRWLGEFHRATSGGAPRPYQPRLVLEHLHAQRASIGLGQLKVADPGFYLRLSAVIEAAATEFTGQPARHARRHGDFSLRNIVIGGSRVGAIDFKPEHTAPVGYDIARLLVDYTALYGDHGKIPDGQLLQGPDRTAFFRAYEFAKPEDAAVGFLLRVQILSEWLRIPAIEEQRGLMQILRLQGLAETALRLFPALRQP